MKIYSFIFFLIFTVFFPVGSNAKEIRNAADVLSFGKEKKGKKEPLIINSREAVFDNKGLSATYKGDVKVKKGDMTLTANSVRSFFTKKTRKIDRIEALGNVHVEKGDRVITAKKGIYYELEKKIVLSGKPRVTQGENTLEGDKISFFIEGDRVVIHGNVRTVFVPKKKKSLEKVKKNKAKKVRIFSDDLMFSKKEERAEYYGNVKVENGNVNLFAQRVHIRFEGTKVVSITAKENIKVVSDDRVVTGGMSEYDIVGDKIIFSGSPKTKTGKSWLKGERIVYFIKDERVIVSSAVSLLYPDEIEKSKKEFSGMKNFTGIGE